MTSRPAAPLPLAAFTTAAWAALVSAAPLLAVVLVAWAADSRSTTAATDAVRFGMNMWLLAHGARLNTEHGSIGLIPLMWTALVVWQLMRAGQSTARAVGARTWKQVAYVAGAVTIAYVSVTVGVALYASTPQLSTPAWLVGIVCGIIASIAAGVGAASSPGLLRALWHALPPWATEGLKAGLGATVLLLAVGGLVAGAALVAATEHVREMLAFGNLGVIGSLALLLLCLLYVPTIAIWATSYLLGPGFAVGTGSGVSPFGVDIGPLPSFPLFAPIAHAPNERIATLFLLAPCVIGIAVGVIVGIRATVTTWQWKLVGIGVACASTSGILTLLAALSGGPIGQERLTAIGPSAWRVGVVALSGLTICAVIGWGVPALLALAGPTPPSEASVPIADASEDSAVSVSADDSTYYPRRNLSDPPEADYNPHPDSSPQRLGQ